MITHTQKKTNKKSNKQKTQRNQWGEMSKQTRNKQETNKQTLQVWDQ
jgi:hypothetical protein